MNLKKIYEKYPTKKDCHCYLEQLLWNNYPQCPYCKSHKFSVLNNTYRYHCNNCNTSYSVTVNTIFHKTKIDLQKWFLAIKLIMNYGNKISSRKLAAEIRTTKDTANRIINALVDELKKSDNIILKIMKYEQIT